MYLFLLWLRDRNFENTLGPVLPKSHTARIIVNNDLGQLVDLMSRGYVFGKRYMISGFARSTFKMMLDVTEDRTCAWVNSDLMASTFRLTSPGCPLRTFMVRCFAHLVHDPNGSSDVFANYNDFGMIDGFLGAYLLVMESTHNHALTLEETRKLPEMFAELGWYTYSTYVKDLPSSST